VFLADRGFADTDLTAIPVIWLFALT